MHYTTEVFLISLVATFGYGVAIFLVDTPILFRVLGLIIGFLSTYLLNSRARQN
jgi:hypothetical protein